MSDEQKNQVPEGEPSKSNVSLSRGGNAYFDIKGHLVRVWFSIWTGEEHVYVDDARVSRTFSWRLVSTHHFEIDGEPYRVELGFNKISDFFFGRYFVRLYSGSELIDQDWISVSGHKAERSSWASYLILFVAGLLVGFLIGGSLIAISNLIW